MEKKKIALIIVAVVGLLLLCCGGTVIAGIVFKEQLKTEQIIEKYLGIDLNDDNGKEDDGNKDDDNNGNKDDDNDGDKDKELTSDEALEALKNHSNNIKNSKEEAEGSMVMKMDMTYGGETITSEMKMDFTMEYLADYEKQLLEGSMNLDGYSKNSYDPSSNVDIDLGYDVFVKEEEVYYKEFGGSVYSQDLDLDNDFTPPTDFENFWEDDENTQKIIDALEYDKEEKYNNIECYKFIIDDPEKIISLMGEEIDLEDLEDQGFTVDFGKTLVEYWVDKKTGLPVGLNTEVEITATDSQQGMDAEIAVLLNIKQVFVEINQGVEIEIPRELR